MVRVISGALVATGLSVLIALEAGPASATQYDTGANDTTIKIGQTYPLSGPDSGASFGARAMAAYFAMLNDKGGVNGRKIELQTLDDGYSPPKTVEQTRRLVESDGVLLMFASLGTPTSEAVRPYLNNKKVPQLFLVSGASSVVDPKRYPWTMAGIPSYAAEGRIFAKYILAEKPDARSRSFTRMTISVAITSTHSSGNSAIGRRRWSLPRRPIRSPIRPSPRR